MSSPDKPLQAAQAQKLFHAPNRDERVCPFMSDALTNMPVACLTEQCAMWAGGCSALPVAQKHA